MTQSSPHTSPTTTTQALLPGLASSSTITPQPQLDILKTHIIPATDPTPLNTLQNLLDTNPHNHWLLTLSYNLAPTIEPSVPTSPTSPTSPTTFPHIIAQRCTPAASSSSPALAGEVPAQQAEGVFSSSKDWSINPKKLHLINKSHYINMVQKALDYIAAGDIYQVNLTHPITIPFIGSSKSLAQHLFHHTNPTMGSFTCFDNDTNSDHPTRHAIISLSPETFLTYNQNTNTLTTIPMKGTSPASDDPQNLYHSKKDRAELNMIIDLMRNDLAKISTPSSVKITNPRQITTHHNSVHQATATIQSTLRDNTSLSQILAATFPPGSITGAPKIRAMQIINKLESSPLAGWASSPSLQKPIPRGPYCGSTIHLTPTGSFNASVNIRTLHIQGTPDPTSPDTFKNATLTYHTGAGIVADSIPQQEWQETLTKAAILESTLGISLSRDQ